MQALKIRLAQSSPIAANVLGLADGSEAHSDAMFNELREWAKALLIVTLLYALLFVCQHVVASTADQFQQASDTLEGWVKGNLGKTAALCCVIFGMFAAAFKKDWMYMLGGIALGVIAGVILGIIDGSFTATI